METIYFNNCTGYNKNGTTLIIPDAARKSCRQAWLFAREHGFPLNQHVHVDIPDGKSLETVRFGYRWYSHKIRMYARSKGFKAVMVAVRSCDPETNNNAKIDFLFRVPVSDQSHFKAIVGKWLYAPKVTTVNYDEITGPDGIKHSAFNDVFTATSEQFGEKHPELPRTLSGDVLGPRTFSSRHLWTKKQIEFRRKKQAPF